MRLNQNSSEKKECAIESANTSSKDTSSLPSNNSKEISITNESLSSDSKTKISNVNMNIKSNTNSIDKVDSDSYDEEMRELMSALRTRKSPGLGVPITSGLGAIPLNNTRVNDIYSSDNGSNNTKVDSSSDRKNVSSNYKVGDRVRLTGR